MYVPRFTEKSSNAININTCQRLLYYNLYNDLLYTFHSLHVKVGQYLYTKFMQQHCLKLIHCVNAQCKNKAKPTMLDMWCKEPKFHL